MISRIFSRKQHHTHKNESKRKKSRIHTSVQITKTYIKAGIHWRVQTGPDRKHVIPLGQHPTACSATLLLNGLNGVFVPWSQYSTLYRNVLDHSHSETKDPHRVLA